MKKLVIAFLALAVVSAGAIAQTKPEDAIKLRQSVMRLIGYNFGSIGAMVNDKKPYNKDEAIRNANRVEALSGHPWEFFGPGTDKGAETKAKPDIWKDQAKFEAAGKKMETEVAKLAQVAMNGDKAALKTQFGAAGQTCKVCHDDFKEK